VSEETVPKARETRRRILTRFVGASAGLFAGLAARGTPTALAGNYACCNLAFPHGPFCPSCGTGCWTCPPGYHAHAWYCCYAGSLWGCGECNTGSDCWTGSFTCSRAWRSSAPC
jgi:hypothetical protein